MNKLEYALLIVAIFLSLISILNIFVKETPKQIQIENKTFFEIKEKIEINESQVIMLIPAVDNEGKGVMTKLIVEAKPGNGKVLIDIDNLLFWIDTQESIRTAKKVIQNIFKINLSNIDLIYKIETNAQAVGGPSAGAAITVATYAAITNKKINPNVTITGTINEDGSIGEVGGILAKAKAAKDLGLTLFLVPKGQGKSIELIPKRECYQIGNFEFCSITYEVQQKDISKEVGIKVIEVSNIKEAINYMLS